MKKDRVLKSAGYTEAFSRQKMMRSLLRAGVPKDTADDVVTQVVASGKTSSSHAIHDTVYKKLIKEGRPLAARYNLKRALTQLGPSGYPFEQFVARILEAKGYVVSTNRIMPGRCVSHEIDVLGKKDDKHFIFECKFHNRPGYKSDIQTVLYMKARYDDVREKLEELEHLENEKHHKRTGKILHKNHVHRVWIVTNTAFTSEARKYASCAGVGLMSWRSPVGHSLSELIEETGLHPVTALTQLSNHQKKTIVSKGLVLCREVHTKQHILASAGIGGKKLQNVIAEASGICRQ